MKTKTSLTLSSDLLAKIEKKQPKDDHQPSDANKLAGGATVGVDLIAGRIRAAQRNYPDLAFHLANAESLPATARSFDLVLVFTVFTSILDPRMAANICGEIDRVLAPGGGVLWYDFRIHNPWNRNVRGFNRARIRGLFPGYRHSLRSITLLPPLARRLGRFTPLLYCRLSAWPFLRTHYLGLLTKS